MADESVELVSPDGTITASLPVVLAAMLQKHRGWKKPSRRPVTRARKPAEPVADTLNPAATCDADLPGDIVFAASAYTTVVDPETGEKIRVLKTHCRNEHEYTPENTKLRIRDGKAYRECQNCLGGRRSRAAAKRA